MTPTPDDSAKEAAVPQSPRRGRRRTWATWAGLLATAVATLLATSATAAQGADPAQVCTDQAADGVGPFTVAVRTSPIPGGQGTLYLFYNGDSGYNCAITVGNVSGATYMDVGLRRVDGVGGEKWDDGSFSEYAGPVYLEAAGVCVDTTGAVGDRSVTGYGTNCDF